MAESKVWPVVRVTSGNLLEMYDFMVFGYYATYIGATFFPSDNEFASLMKALMTFGAGYLMRPLGAIILGAYVDRHGRRKGLLVTLALMAIGTLTVACMPGYATAGLAAPLLILGGRLLQGFSAGAEVGGVSVYLAEIATPGRTGFFASWQSASQQLAVALAAIVGIGLTLTLTSDELTRWGWRVPMLIGCLIIPLLFLLRRSLGETDEFAARKRHPAISEILRTLAANWLLVLLGILMATMTTVSFYMITAYTPTFGAVILQLDNAGVQVVILCVGLSNFIWLPVMGALSDRIGRRPILAGAAILMLLTSYPVMSWLVDDPSIGRLLAVELWLSFLYASYNGAMIIHLIEIMPSKVRTSGFSLAYSFATAIFGGFTPALCTYLISITGNRAIPGLWLAVSAGLALIAVAGLSRMSSERVAHVATPQRPDTVHQSLTPGRP